MRPRKSSTVLLENVKALRKASRATGAAIWGALAERMEATRRNKVAVNLSRLNRAVGRGETAAVPGKVLGSGKIDHPVTVAAFQFSTAARRRIEEAGGKPIGILELLQENPEGSGVKLIA
ncbi:MAG: 50S ribosomal protein L18e [Candidatus Bathyarchaeia archaeon]